MFDKRVYFLAVALLFTGRNSYADSPPKNPSQGEQDRYRWSLYCQITLDVASEAIPTEIEFQSVAERKAHFKDWCEKLSNEGAAKASQDSLTMAFSGCVEAVTSSGVIKGFGRGKELTKDASLGLCWN